MDALLKLDLDDIQVPQEDQEEQREAFRITNLEQATWAMRKLRALAAKEAEIRKVAEEEIARINAWLQDEFKGIERSRSFFLGALEGYHRNLIQQDPKAKTVKTPYGKLKLTKQQPEFQRDDALIKAWAKENKPEVLIPQEPKLDWAGLKKQLVVEGDKAIDLTTGEMVPGILVIEREDKFSVEVDSL
ncbi:hypothetical protein BR63_05765 [Thermanaerosceptrum fracticalcis]|uniref:Uncharacterized protein n=1 Tax=Thermanaerosceptrum fracticalcis TaxID=1712410 RepID=A0A7G6E1B1_THEFR|nr:host-nuclease inhibitor Gam family protein [Thermanaerosceptrum fracticalcis]QNB45865.1 hypothetical protein BR63_05765 [Thermanaerosceptrum fracticalcis]